MDGIITVIVVIIIIIILTIRSNNMSTTIGPCTVAEEGCFSRNELAWPCRSLLGVVVPHARAWREVHFLFVGVIYGHDDGTHPGICP
jgi:hypothetical protein